MKAEKADVNSLILGIRMNFEPVCGKERTEEAVEMVKELQRLAAKGLRAEQAEREIEAEIERLNSQLHEHYDYGTSRAVGALRLSIDRLKGVE